MNINTNTQHRSQMYTELEEESGQAQINLNLIQRNNSIPPKQGFFSKTLFLWIYDTIRIGRGRTLRETDLPPLDEKLCSSENQKRFQSALTASQSRFNSTQPNKKWMFLIKLFYDTFKSQVKLVCLLVLGAAIATQLEPFLTVFVLKAYDEPRELNNLLVGVLFFIFFVIFKVLVDVHMNYQNSIMELKMFGAFSSSIMDKIFKLSAVQKEKYTLGDLLNYLQIDIKQANEFYRSMTNLVLFPIRLIICIVIYYTIVGSRANVGLFTSFSQFFINISLGKLYQSYQIQYMKAKDERMNVLDEILTGIKTIKLEAYHYFFSNKISQKRNDETYLALKKNLFALIFNISSKVFYILNLVLCVYFYDISSVGDLLLITSNYGTLSKLLEGLLEHVVKIIIAHSSFTRIQTLLYEETIPNQEMRRNSLMPTNIPSDQSILIENVAFSYPDLSVDNQNTNLQQDKFLLNIEEFSVKKGQLIAVIGSTGSGKSMLLQSLLGETQIEPSNNITSSSFYISSKDIALTTQTQWVMKGTIRDNITFGSNQQFDFERYRQVLSSTQINQDIQELSLQDLTPVSEKGDSLSGGQKRRINLARTIYRGGEIFLLDDVLTGLDSQVSRLVMSECINGPLLQNTTRIIFSSSLNYLNDVDKVYLLHEGQIVKSGTYQEVINSAYYQDISVKYLDHFNDEQVNQDQIQGESEQQSNNNKANQFQLKYTNNVDQIRFGNQEDQKEGKIESWVYKKIFQLFGGGCTAFLFIILGLISTYFQMAQFTILKNDQSASNNEDNQVEEKQESSTSDDFSAIIIKFIIFLIIQEIFDIIKTFLFCFKNYKFCRVFHEKISKSLLNASYSEFYCNYPTGILSNRLSNDIMSVDSKIYELLSPILSIAFGCLGIFFVFLTLQLASVYVINLISIIAWIYITKVYMQVQRECTRIETVSKSPILNYFSEIYRGSQYIKQCADRKIPIREFQSYLNTNIRNQIISSTVTNFYIFVILTVLIAFESSLFIAMFYDTSVSGEKVAMVLITAINMGLLVMSALLIWSLFETHAGINIERCCKLAYQIPEEKGSPFQLENSSNQQQSYENDTELVNIQQGTIQAQSASFGIKNANLEIIKNLTFNVNAREKVGIVGRTGAGKTSLTNGLTSLLDLISGEVVINEKLIQNYEAQDLRQQFSVIPQEPFIFEGTLKQNIDPSSKFPQSKLQSVYNELNLSEHSSFKLGLNSAIHLKGSNLSVGEKQLISIARCLLKNSSIILIDEATSCLDQNTEKKITDLVADKLKDKTILTIAHKLNTVLQSDRIFVINSGQLVEQGQPQALLAQQNKSIFYQMLKRFIN